MFRASGMHTADKYICLWKGNTACWVDLRPIFEVCARGARVQGRGTLKESVVAERGNRWITQGHGRGGLTGGAAKAEMAGHPSRSERERRRKGNGNQPHIVEGGICTRRGRAGTVYGWWENGVGSREFWYEMRETGSVQVYGRPHGSEVCRWDTWQ